MDKLIFPAFNFIHSGDGRSGADWIKLRDKNNEEKIIKGNRMKVFKKAILASSLLFAINANAAVVTENLTVSVLSGDFVGTTGTGWFSYDDALLTNVGDESIAAVDGLTLSLNVFGQSFTEANDIDYSGYPVLSFYDGMIQTLDFYVTEGSVAGPDCVECSSNFTDITLDGVYDLSLYDLSAVATGGYEAELYVNGFANPVPVPAAVWLFGSGLIGLAGLARRKQS